MCTSNTTLTPNYLKLPVIYYINIFCLQCKWLLSLAFVTEANFYAILNFRPLI